MDKDTTRLGNDSGESSMTKREQIIKILEKINMKNINQGMDIFNNAVQDFGNLWIQ